MNRNIQAVFVMVIIINTVLASFLVSLVAGTSSPFKGLFTRISDLYKAVLETNRLAPSEVVLSGGSQRYFAKTLTGTGNLHVRGHPT